MKQRIVEKDKIGKNGHIYTVYKGYLDYLSTHLIMGIIALPIVLIIGMIMLFFAILKWIVNTLTNFILSKSKKLSKTSATVISIIIVILVLGIIGAFVTDNENTIETSSNATTSNFSNIQNVIENNNINEEITDNNSSDVNNSIENNNINEVITDNSNSVANNSIENIQKNETITTNSPQNTQNNSTVSTKSDDITVYIGNSGNKYHRQSCSTLKGKGKAITYKQAISQGRQACERCKP